MVAVRMVLAVACIGAWLAAYGQTGPWVRTPSPSSSSAETAQATATSHQPILFLFERTLDLPSGDLRRITLPRVKAGTMIVLEAETEQSGPSMDLRNLRIEILHDPSALADSALAAEADGRGKRRSQMRSMAVYAGPWDPALRFRTPQDGRYVVVLRQQNAEGTPLPLSLRVRLLPSPVTAKVTEPITLPQNTRSAVAIFSAGLLWTTLLLFGTPVIRAFRSRRRQEGPPWFA